MTVISYETAAKVLVDGGYLVTGTDLLDGPLIHPDEQMFPNAPLVSAIVLPGRGFTSSGTYGDLPSVRRRGAVLARSTAWTCHS